MKAAVLLALLLWQAAPRSEPPVAQPEHMQYERTINVPPGSGQACAVLDAQIFPQAAPSLKDLRIFPAGSARASSGPGVPHEVPYAITLSESATQEIQPARLLNLGGIRTPHGAKVVFDLEMPPRPYTDVTLDLDPGIHNFIATATVSGSDSPGTQEKSTALGSFTLFDLSAQHLSRDTTLPLAESTFRFLHVVLSVSPAPGSPDASSAVFAPAMVEGAQVPPSREAQVLYTTVAETTSIVTSGRESRASFVLPTRVPVERVSFVLAPDFKANFSRDVRITALATPSGTASGNSGATTAAGEIADGVGESGQPSLPETITGTILRVHSTQTGREIHTEQLNLPAILGANLQSSAKVEVVVENGDDQPLPISVVRLEMRQRKICFDIPPGTGSGLTLFYGDPRLAAPIYDYDRLFVASSNPLAAQLGPERLNPNYRPLPAEAVPFTERYPQLLWIVLIVVISALGVVALKSSRNVGV